MYKVIIGSVSWDYQYATIVLGIATSDENVKKIISEAEEKYGEDMVTVKAIVEVDNLDEFTPYHFENNCLDYSD